MAALRRDRLKGSCARKHTPVARQGEALNQLAAFSLYSSILESYHDRVAAHDLLPTRIRLR